MLSVLHEHVHVGVHILIHACVQRHACVHVRVLDSHVDVHVHVPAEGINVPWNLCTCPCYVCICMYITLHIYKCACTVQYSVHVHVPAEDIHVPWNLCTVYVYVLFSITLHIDQMHMCWFCTRFEDSQTKGKEKIFCCPRTEVHSEIVSSDAQSCFSYGGLL